MKKNKKKRELTKKVTLYVYRSPLEFRCFVRMWKDASISSAAIEPELLGSVSHSPSGVAIVVVGHKAIMQVD